MVRIAACALVAVAAAGLMAQEGYPTTFEKVTKQPAPKKLENKAQLSEAPAFDVHFFQPDEYLVSSEPFTGGTAWKVARLAQMLTPASKDTKGEAEFFILAGDHKGQKLWTKHYARTRPATKEDMKLGAVVYHLDNGTDDKQVYVLPQSRENLLECNWFIGGVNDVSTMYKGYVSVSGYFCTPAGCRVAVK